MEKEYFKVKITKGMGWSISSVGEVYTVYSEDDVNHGVIFYVKDSPSQQFIFPVNCVRLEEPASDKAIYKILNDVLTRIDSVESRIVYLNKNKIDLPIPSQEQFESFCKRNKEFVNAYEKYIAKEKKPRIPDENTPVDTLVRVRNTPDENWNLRYFCEIKNNKFRCYHSGSTSKTTQTYVPSWLMCEIVEETLEEKRARIFHKFVPEEYKWHAVDKNNQSKYYTNKPRFSKDCDMFLADDGLFTFAGYADPYNWENSLIGREV